MRIMTATKIVAYYVLITLYVALISYVFWLEDVSDWSVLEWITYCFIASSFPYLFLNIWGLWFGHPFYNDEPLGDLNRIPAPKLFFRIVTRGTTPQLVQATVNSALDVLSCLQNNHAYHIEVVTDHPNHLTLNPQVSEIVVPPSFTCTTKYKGRALQYAIGDGVSMARNTDWLVHLDEETRFDRHTLLNILRFTTNEENEYLQGNSRWPRVGQGVITYGQKRPISFPHLITTLADSIRVTDDFGRFRLQYVFETSLFGMKGSYIVIRNDLEKYISFDHGPKSSVTEDAFFALYARSKNIGFKFVRGLMYERSPFGFMDFIRQRKRWFIGLTATITASKIPLWYRKELIMCMLIWVLQPLSYFWILVNFFTTFNYDWTPVAQLLINPFTFIYLLGFILSVERREFSLPEYITLLLLQVLLIPLFSLMEFSGIVYAFLTWDMGFFVVQKEVTPRPQLLETELSTLTSDLTTLELCEEIIEFEPSSSIDDVSSII